MDEKFIAKVLKSVVGQEVIVIVTVSFCIPQK